MDASPEDGEVLRGNGVDFDLVNFGLDIVGGELVSSNPLKVEGQIWSTTDGFKFPDNTTQTTAAVSYSPPSIADLTILGNISGGAAAASASTLTDFLDAIVGTDQGGLITRDATEWVILAPGTADYVLTSGGTGADLSWSAGKTWTTVKKTADQAITSSATLVDDDELFFSVAANTKYSIRFTMFFSGPTGGARIGINGPSSPDLVMSKTVDTVIVSALNRFLTSAFPVLAYGNLFVSIVVAIGGPITFEVLLHNGANAGTFAVQIAQGGGSPTATQFLAGSYLEWMEIA